MSRPADLFSIGCVLLLGALMGLAAEQDWPHWRGPNYDGISPEKGFETKWDSPPPKVWQREIGSAFSGLTCVAGRVYTCGTADHQQVAICLDAKTGEVIWQTPFEAEYRERQGGDGTRVTPTFNDGCIYILGAQGKLVCLNASDGKELWRREFDAPPAWGYSASVLVEDNLAILTAGGPAGTLLAVDKKTGKDVWSCGSGLVGYATPYPFTLEGTRYVVGFMGKEALIAELKTGKQVWSMPWETSYDINAAAPIFHDGRLLLSSGYNHGVILVKLSREGDKLKSEPVWENKTIRAKFQSPVLYDGYLYVSDEVGLKCVDWKTGEAKWQEKGTTNGTVLVADGHLIVLTEKGELLIAPASPKAFEPTTKVALLTKRCWTIPTLYRGFLFARNLDRVECVKLTR